jgi:Lar family restriction alleviation protein
MSELKPCPFCGGGIDERGGQCNYAKETMVLDLKCMSCGTIFKFKSKWVTNPYKEAIEAWNRRVDNGCTSMW